jgi:hypothetical protein
MDVGELIKRLKAIRCWVQSESTACEKINELITALGGKP